MKSKIPQLLYLTTFLFTFNGLAQNPTFEWAKQMGGTGLDNGNSITTDIYGNVLTCGLFEGTVDFNPGSGIRNLVSAEWVDIFIQKLDANGQLLWAKRVGGLGIQEANSIATDAYGNVYITGVFENTVDFNPGSGRANLTSNGGLDIFVLKLDSNGIYKWAKSMGDFGGDYGYSLAIDNKGSIYSTGFFTDTVPS